MFDVFLPLNVVLILANSTDYDEMQLKAAFHLFFLLFAKVPVQGCPVYKGLPVIISLSLFVNK